MHFVQYKQMRLPARSTSAGGLSVLQHVLFIRC